MEIEFDEDIKFNFFTLNSNYNNNNNTDNNSKGSEPLLSIRNYQNL